MKIRIQFGALHGKLREVAWYDDILKMPRVVEFEGEHWEWLAYEEAKDGRVDYILTYGACPPTMFLGLEVPAFEQMFNWQVGQEVKCECGSAYDRHFPQIHSSWCPKTRYP